MSQKRKIAKLYVRSCLDPNELAVYFGLRDAYSVQKFAEELYGPTYEVQRKANYLKLLEREAQYTYWPFPNLAGEY